MAWMVDRISKKVHEPVPMTGKTRAAGGIVLALALLIGAVEWLQRRSDPRGSAGAPVGVVPPSRERVPAAPRPAVPVFVTAHDGGAPADPRLAAARARAIDMLDRLTRENLAAAGGARRDTYIRQQWAIEERSLDAAAAEIGLDDGTRRRIGAIMAGLTRTRESLRASPDPAASRGLLGNDVRADEAQARAYAEVRALVGPAAFVKLTAAQRAIARTLRRSLRQAGALPAPAGQP